MTIQIKPIVLARKEMTVAQPDSTMPERPLTTRPHAIRVLCVDDHPLVVDGLRAQFEIDARIEVVGQLASATDLVQEARRLNPHAVLLDIEMPGPDAFEMADRLRHACPGVRIIVLSAYARDSYVSAAFSAGACAYFTKSDDVREIIEGIREVAGSPPGAFLLGPTLKERFLTPQASATGPRRAAQRLHAAAPTHEEPIVTPLGTLTPRELEILRLIGKGLGRVQIAAQLSRSVKTVDGHQERMMRKLSVTTRAQLMRLAIREGLAVP
jgi:DNA-binding NarL/FixJ family response regulator